MALKRKPKDKNKENVHRLTSDKQGVAGFFEIFLRRFKTFSFMLVLSPITILCLGVIGLSLLPGVVLGHFLLQWAAPYGWLLQCLAIAFALSFGFFLYGLSILFLAPVVNFMLPLKVGAWRGNMRSVQTIPWYVHNALVYIVRYSFLDFITPSPLTNMFYKNMGMKIGKGVLINTSNISDPCLITLEDHVTIGGSATILAHYGQKGYLILAPVHIKKGANIGLKASVMGDVVIGENATIRPHAVVLPKTRIGDGEVF